MSSKPLTKRLFMKEGYRVLLIEEPDGFRKQLGDLPPDVEITTTPKDHYDIIQVFCRERKELEDRVPKKLEYMKEGGYLWIAYPKGSSKVKTDINRDSIWEYAKGFGLKAVHQISIDETWSSMRFRKE